MAIDIKSLIMKKTESVSNKKLVMKDVNRDLIVALLSIPVYGKEARDEEILSVIINAGNAEENSCMDKIRAHYNELVSSKKIVKTKGGDVTDKDGFMVLVPR